VTFYDSTPGLAAEQRRRVVQNSESVAVAVHHVWGDISAVGPGEGTVPIGFPVTFVEKPGFYFGAESLDGDVIPGHFPTISLVVSTWQTKRVVSGFYYSGMVVAFVIGGPIGTNMGIHWHVEGKAFKNPTSHDGSIQVR